MPVEIICSLLAALGVLLSALISWLVARSTANKEIEKMKLSWAREDSLSASDEFADMAKSVAYYVTSLREGFRDRYSIEAASKVAALRTKEAGSLAAALDELYRLLQGSSMDEIDESLSKVIELRREGKLNNQ